jgi:transposase
MRYIGVDLHKRLVVVCVVEVQDGKRVVVERGRWSNQDTAGMEGFLRAQVPFQLVVESTSCYEWFVELAEPLADRVVLAHPRKLRVIAESTRKTDRLDAQVLAEFLALGMIPEAHRAPPRLREHRTLVRHRCFLKRRTTSLKNKLRWLVTRYNADVPGLFTVQGREHLRSVALSPADRFAAEQLLAELDHYQGQIADLDRRLREFAKTAPAAEREARALLATMLGMGPVTIDAVLCELGDVRRFRSQRQVVAYAGLAPGIRQSAGRTKQQGITKEGSRLLRWTLVEFAWRIVRQTRRWGFVYERLKQRRGAKRAIVAVARRLLCVIVSLLRSGKAYSLATELAA